MFEYHARMRNEKADIVILGSGFAGSLLALIAHKIGLRVVLLEKGRHPRFRVGESSTPLGNLKLESLADTYDLGWLKPFCNYGSWKRTYPDIACGLKRGFSFFRHRPGKPFRPVPDHTNELLVTANPDDERGDTQWFRADFDAFLVKKVTEAGITYLDGFDTTSIKRDKPWVVRGRRGDEEIEITASFAVDATGDGQALTEAVGNQSTDEGFYTSSRAVFGHFENVAPWREILSGRGHPLDDHPFDCDASALHHIIDGGWMWVLRFDNGIVSAGFSLDPKKYPADRTVTADQEWRRLMFQYPSIRRQFRRAKPVQPLSATLRMQRRLRNAAGEDWAALPHAVCFVDPFLSPGIAHTLFGVERLARIFKDKWDAPDRVESLDEYSRSVYREMKRYDRIIAACMQGADRFDIMVQTTMLYFVAATFSEERMRSGQAGESDEFLLAHDESYAKIVGKICNAVSSDRVSTPESFANRVTRALSAYNNVGLCDPQKQNMYPFKTPGDDENAKDASQDTEDSSSDD